MDQFERVEQAVASIRKRCQSTISHALILGTGLGSLADSLTNEVVIDYADISGFPVSTAPLHKGRLVIAELAGHLLAVMQGRLHLHEGWSAQDIALPVRVLRRLGADRMIITNAAGGAEQQFCCWSNHADYRPYQFDRTQSADRRAG